MSYISFINKCIYPQILFLKINFKILIFLFSSPADQWRRKPVWEWFSRDTPGPRRRGTCLHVGPPVPALCDDPGLHTDPHRGLPRLHGELGHPAGAGRATLRASVSPERNQPGRLQENQVCSAGPETNRRYRGLLRRPRQRGPPSIRSDHWEAVWPRSRWGPEETSRSRRPGPRSRCRSRWWWRRRRRRRPGGAGGDSHSAPPAGLHQDEVGPDRGAGRGGGGGPGLQSHHSGVRRGVAQHGGPGILQRHGRLHDT